ncbi:hypothetical protein R1sor_002349 [Riccia sorocarpa]|uniref:SAM domain-containing protein n=1 Tax=Riccia sorocarpa TaxID=122646 RepID=A0ABD3H168_9MARC
MAGDTDLDLALAIALAEESDGYSDGDFKNSSKQVELRQQSLLAKCRNKLPAKSKKLGSHNNKRQKTTQGKDSGSSKSRQGQSQRKNDGKDPKKSAAIVVEGVEQCGNLGKSVQTGNMFDSFRYQAPQFQDVSLPHECLEDDLPVAKLQDVELTVHENNAPPLESTEDEELILTTNIASPEASQTCLHELQRRGQDVSVITTVQEHDIRNHQSPPTEDHLEEEIVSLDQESQFSALLRLCSEQAAEPEFTTKEPAAIVVEPGAGRTGSLEDMGRLSLDGTASDHLCDVDGSIDDISCLMTQQRGPKPAESHPCMDGSIPALQDITNRDKSVEDHERRTLEADREKINIVCPICGDDLGEVALELRVKHTEACLDKTGEPKDCLGREASPEPTPLTRDTSISFGCEKVMQWLEGLSLSRYIDTFNQHEIDWDTLQWLTDEDLQLIGVTCLGPRRKILGALQELELRGSGKTTVSAVLPATRVEDDILKNVLINDDTLRNMLINGSRLEDDASRGVQPRGKDPVKLITNFFPVTSVTGEKRVPDAVNQQVLISRRARSSRMTTSRPRISQRASIRGVPAWMCIPGTPFRVDAFQHLSGDCSHWFLTHFHTDHYQGLTRGFRYGRVFCSAITARLVNLRIGVSWDRLVIVPMNEKLKICGVDVTFIDANHCPGSVMILFEPPNCEAVLHTGDFRFCSAMADNSALLSTTVHTLILDTTYCDRQYDFPKQETVIQFVIEAIQAESFNRETLFLIGTYTIGKERIFLEVGKVLQKKIYVGSAKMKLLECMELSAEDTKWLTCNDRESFIHVVPLWSISSFKRMNSISRHYHGRYKLIVAFSPNRYEVPYSEHSSFCELREFVRFIAPVDIIPSVPGKTANGHDDMVASLWSEEQ